MGAMAASSSPPQLRDDPPATYAFSIHGVRLTYRADTTALVRRLRAMIGPFEVRAGSEPEDFLLEVLHEPGPYAPAAPPGMAEHWRGQLPDGTPAVWYRGAGAQETVLPGRARMRLTDRAAVVRVAPDADWCLNLGCILPALCIFLGRRGHYVIHAASLSVEAAGRRRGLLLSGRSGLGKTTTALALAHAGMQLHTDDATFLHAPEGAPDAARIWGLPRPCKVHRHTIELMPWLRPHCIGNRTLDDEHMVELAALAGPGALERAEPALVLFLEQRNPHAHRLRPLPKVEAVTRLVDENVRAVDPRAQGPAGRAFRAMAEMLGRCDTYALSVGPDLPTLHQLIRPLVVDPR